MAPLPAPSPRASFTLIELLVVIAIVAILSAVVIITLNPAELLKQSRDSNRLSDLNTLNKALALFEVDVVGGSLGSSSTVYVSLPDTSGCGDAETWSGSEAHYTTNSKLVRYSANFIGADDCVQVPDAASLKP